MASDIIGVNSVYDSIKDVKYSDHLLENNILDEPLYENGEVVKKLYQANNKLSKSLMRIHEETLSPVKEENIYENISFHENKLNSINEIKSVNPVLKNDTNLEEDENDDSPEENLNISNNNNITSESNKSLYTSTISLTIGKPIVSMETDSPEENELNFNITTHKSREGSTESNDETFKSSYAKSLIDSYRKSTPNIQCTNAMIKEEKPVVRQLVTKQDFKTQNELNSTQTQTKAFGPTNLDNQSRLIEGLESKISSLTDNILLKDKELEKLRQELMFMKLECNRVKAENRSLKASLNNEISSRSLLNVDGHPHSPVSSVSSDSDTWTLQQQIMSLNAQLEKAELSRHAYEAATKQLVHFLQTINSTLTTVGGPDTKFQSPFTSQNTSELLTNLQSSLMENRIRTVSPKIKTNPYFENSRDGGYLGQKVDFRSTLESDRKSPHPPKADSIGVPSPFKDKENALPSREESDTAGKDMLTCPILAICDKKDAEAVVVNLKDVTCNKKGNNEGKKRSSPQRRFSISQKIWNPTKRPLVRSGSVNNLPTELSAYPRVSRAVSTHCVALSKLETLPNEFDETPDPTSTTSQRIKSSKAKDFFSSLKNLFRPEEKPSQEIINKKKSSSQTSQKKSKVKIDFLSSSPATSSPLSTMTHAAAATNQKRHSIKALSVPLHESPLHDAEVQTSTPNSTFYVPFRCSPKDIETEKYFQGDRETPKLAKDTPLQEEEEEMEEELMSGPKEISLTLPKESENVVDTPVSSKSKEEEWLQLPSRAHFLTYVTGGGISTFSISNDDVRISDFDSKDSYFKTYGRVDGTKSLELEQCMTSWKEKLSRAKSCWGDEVDKAKSSNRRASRGLTRRSSDFDAVGLRLWKLSRESFRAKACRVEFV